MTTTSDKPISGLPWLADKHRKYVWIAVIIASYALLGFFLAPWLVKKYAIESIGEMYAAEANEGWPSGPTPEDPSPMTRMMIFAFAIRGGAVNWRDEVPRDPFR